MKKILFTLLLISVFSCKKPEDKGYEAAAAFFVVEQINPSGTNNPYLCEYRLGLYNNTNGMGSNDGRLGVYDTIGKFQINDTIYLKSVYPH